MKIKIETNENQVKAHSPYHPNLPGPAKALGGKWDPNNKSWVFDARDEERVRDLYRKIYGTDGSPAANLDLVTLRVEFTSKYTSEMRSGVFVAGRCVAAARGRDSGARLGQGVVLLEGYVSSGGSVKHWCTELGKGTVLEIRDLPRAAAEEAITDDLYYKAEIVGNGKGPHPNKDALLAEKETLLKRLAEIESQLTELA